jgi:hypothetical protein
VTTPHHIGQVAKAEMIVAHVLELAPADADHDRIAGVVVKSLTEAGLLVTRDRSGVPALRPVNVATEAERRARIEEAGANLAAVKLRMTTKGDVA